MKRSLAVLVMAALLAGGRGAIAQQMDHASHMAATQDGKTGGRNQAGQAAFAAIGEIVERLKGDSTTDWSKVNIEALRQHLIDMDDVMMRSVVAQQPVAGGAQFDVTGTGRTVEAIQRIAKNHAMMLEHEGDYRATVVQIANGIRMTVTAADSRNANQTAQIRGLGFAGLFTDGDHHVMHHMMIARGNDPHGK